MRMLFCLLLACWAGTASAQFNPNGFGSAGFGGGSSAASGAQGGSLMNIPVVDLSAPLFANFMQSSSIGNMSASNWGLLADNGLPNGNSLAANYTVTPTIPASSTSEVFVIDWTGTIPANSLTMFGATNATLCTSTAGSGCGSNCISSGGAGTGNTTFGRATTSGQNCRVEFTFAVAPTGAISSPVMFFNSGTAPNLTTLRFFRKRDETNNGGVLPTWNPDFITAVGSSGSNSRILRTMGNVLNAGQENVLTNPAYALRTPIGAISYGSKRFPYSQIGVGTLTLTGVNWAASASYPGQPGNWVDKEVFQGNFQSVGVSITVTGAANNGSGLVRLTVADTSSLTTGQVIAYTGYNNVGGPGFGLWNITVVDGTHVDLATSYPAGNASVFATYNSVPGFFTAMTMQIGARTPKPLIGPGSFPMGANNINVIAAGIGTCMYDGQLDAVICSPGGLYSGLSPELAVSLANASNTDLWLNFSAYIDDASAASIAQMVSSTLNSSLKVYIEYDNEPWNAGFYQYFLFSKKAEAVGITTTPTQSSGPGTFSWQGLRSAQIFRIFAANWSGDATRVIGSFNVQFAPGATTNGVVANGFNGVLLDPTSKSRLCAYLGGTFSGTCSGAINYSASPNRPIDVTRNVSYAPYAGAKYNASGVSAAAVTYQTNQASALASLTTIMTTSYTGNTAYAEWEASLTTYDAGRPSGYAPLFVVTYEGGPDMWAASIADYTSLGLTSAATATFNVGTSPAVNQTGHPYINGGKVRFSGGSGYTGIAASQDYFVMNAAANSYDVSLTYYNQTAVVVGGTPTGTITATGSTTSIDNLYEAWKNSSAASSWMASYNANFKSFSHSQRIGMLQMVGNNWNLSLQNSSTQNANNRWSIYQQNFTPVAVPYQFLTGLRQLNFLLKRDLDPASNDNDPMWLEKAA